MKKMIHKLNSLLEDAARQYPYHVLAVLATLMAVPILAAFIL